MSNKRCSYTYCNPKPGQNAQCNRDIAPCFSREYCGKHAIHDPSVQKYWPKCTRGRDYSAHKKNVWPWAFLTEVIRVLDIMELTTDRSLSGIDAFVKNTPGFEGPRCQFCMVADNERLTAVNVTDSAFPKLCDAAPVQPWFKPISKPIVKPTFRFSQLGNGPRVPPPAQMSPNAFIPRDSMGNLMVTFCKKRPGGPGSHYKHTYIEPAFPVSKYDRKLVTNAPMRADEFAYIKEAAAKLSVDLENMSLDTIYDGFIRTGDSESRDILLEYLVFAL